MSDEDIIPKPDSSPVATAMLVASCVGVLLATMLVWNELATFYLPAEKSKSVVLGKEFHPPGKIKKKFQGKPVDYYKIDFGNADIEGDARGDSSGG